MACPRRGPFVVWKRYKIMKIRNYVLSLVLAGLAGVSIAGASAQVLNTRLVSHLSLGADTATREVWAEGNFIYVARGEHGLDIIDASNQAAPVRRSTILPFAHADISDVHVVQDPVREAMRAGLKVGLRLPWLMFVARTIRLDQFFIVRRNVPGLSFAVRNHGALRRVLVSTRQAEELAKQVFHLKHMPLGDRCSPTCSSREPSLRRSAF